jgi:hypothetical protein
VHAVAALNHPNICTVHDVGPNYLVMELVEGPTLAERIKRGALPPEEALGIARQMADALEAAHEKGIVHRDLKPGNVKITPSGTVKVLDFGLAKVEPAAGGESQAEVADTLTIGMTEAGVILGTVAYMAPEQARGEPVDKRADIWAFGVVLHEMLTGCRLFRGATLSDTLAAVLTKEPEWDRIPPQIHRLLRRCLEKDPKRRLRDIGDAMPLLEDAPMAAEPPKLWVRLLPWVVTAVVAGIAAVLAFGLARTDRMAPASPVTRFELAVPPEALRGFSVSPDGRMLAYSAPSQGRSMIWVRALDSLIAQPRSGTEDGAFPFWSPDSKSIAFFAGDKLKRTDAAGGQVQVVCEGLAGQPRGAAWGAGGVVIFSLTGGLQRVAASGGKPMPLTEINRSQEVTHAWPFFLSDGRRFLYFSEGAGGLPSTVYASSLEKPQERVRILDTDMGAVYAAGAEGRPDYLVYRRQGNLVAQHFDPDHLRVEGEATPLAEQVGYAVALELQAASSYNGVLVYGSQPAGTTRITWVGRDGKTLEVVGPPDVYQYPQLSPDGRRVLLGRDQKGLSAWAYELGRDVMTPVTFSVTLSPQWSPDGEWIVFSKQVQRGLYRKRANGAGEEERLTMSANVQMPTSWSPGGRFVLYSETDPKTKGDLWILPLEGDRKPGPFLQTPFNETQGQFSPDGKWVAYASDESGRNEISIRAFSPDNFAKASGDGGKWPVSNSGGQMPRWRGDGKELYYMSGARLMAVAIQAGAKGIEPGTPRELFPLSSRTYDVVRDGQRFLVLNPVESASLTVITNWPGLLPK